MLLTKTMRRSRKSRRKMPMAPQGCRLRLLGGTATRARGRRAVVASLAALSVVWWQLAVAAAPTIVAPIPGPPQINASAYLLVDAVSGKVILEENADERLPPASLTKIMTGYVVASELAANRVAETDLVPISIKAWKTEGSKMFIREGTNVKLGDLVRGIIIQSGNDASVAAAEHVAGDEDAFAGMMNATAAALGMTGSNYANATGLPADDHYTTARDLATLAVRLINDFPEHYAIYSEREFTYNEIRQSNRNRLLWRDSTVDGIKTGHTEAAGYCLVASAVRDGMRLISVVLGTSSDAVRMTESGKLLTYGFRYFETHQVYQGTEVLKTTEVWFGESESAELGVAAPMLITIPRGRYDDLEAAAEVGHIIRAPLAAGDTVGTVRLSLDGELVAEAPLVVRTAVEEAGFFKRMWHHVYIFFRELFS